MIFFTVNRVIKYLILSDIAFYTGWGLVTPVFAIFIVDKIQGGNAFIAGVASAVYWVVSSALRVPISLFLDRRAGEKDDYYSLIAGLFIASLAPFGFLFARLPWHIYFLQAIYGLGMAMSLSGWTAIFTRHIDKGREATEWGLNATTLGLGVGISSALGGLLVTKFGFEFVFFSFD